MKVDASVTREDVVAWFLRLNGFFTTENFVVHQPERSVNKGQRTEADVLGVRFPQRAERVAGLFLKDHELFSGVAVPVFVIAEATSGPCKLNGPWTRPAGENLKHLLRAVGCPSDLVPSVADGLYKVGVFKGSCLEARMLSVGNVRAANLPRGCSQLTWLELLGFCYDRFTAFLSYKGDHQQWPSVGQVLWPRREDTTKDAYVERMLALVQDLQPRAPHGP